MTFEQAQINALKDANDLATEVCKIVSHFDHGERGATLRAFGTARLVAYLLKRVTQGEDLIQAIVHADAQTEPVTVSWACDPGRTGDHSKCSGDKDSCACQCHRS